MVSEDYTRDAARAAPNGARRRVNTPVPAAARREPSPGASARREPSPGAVTRREPSPGASATARIHPGKPTQPLRALSSAPTPPRSLASSPGPARAGLAPSRVPSKTIGPASHVFQRGSVLVATPIVFFGAWLVLCTSGAERSNRIAVFQELQRQSFVHQSAFLDDLGGQPPPQLWATWAFGSDSAAANIWLDLSAIPLTTTVLSDDTDMEDEVPLLQGTTDDEEVRFSSIVYRAKTPYRALLSLEDDAAPSVIASIAAKSRPSTLVIRLSDEHIILHHSNIELVRWLPVADVSWGSEACAHASGSFDIRTGRCIAQHIITRLCYAVKPGASPHDGALTSDCEYGHRSPLYTPVRQFDGMLEIVLRSSMDSYVQASEVTLGCSNCFGFPYGDLGKIGAGESACGAVPHGRPSVKRAISYALDIFAQTPAQGRCFGRPQRNLRALGLVLLGLGVSILAFMHHDQKRRHQLFLMVFLSTVASLCKQFGLFVQ